MSISAMKQALEALEGLWDDGFGGVPESMHKDAITTLRQALAQPEQEPVGACVTCGAPKSEWLVDAVNISQERVDETAKCEHEPVAWFIQYEYRHEFLWREPAAYEKNSALEIKPLYTAPPISDYHEGWEEGFKAAKREWVGLTDEEIYDYADKFLYQHGSNYGIKSFGKAIEQALKEKNT